MGRPDEAFGDFGVALVVDLEPAVVHQSGPRACDDPTWGQHLEGTGMDPLDHFGRDVVSSTLGDEGLLEAAVTPDLGKSLRGFATLAHYLNSARIIRHRSGEDNAGDEQSQGVDQAVDTPRDLLAGVISPGGSGHRGRSADAACIDDRARGICLVTFSFAHHLTLTRADRLPGPVP
jgi:hypothetical protein